MLYLSFSSDGRRIICSRNPRLKMDKLTTMELWKITEDILLRPRNITFDNYMLLTTKQSKGESIEHLFGKLKEFSENCHLLNQEDDLIRDLFIANMQDPEIQRELLRETFEPAQALRLAINMELAQRSQLQISNNQSSLHVNSKNPHRPLRQQNQRQNFAAPIRQTNKLSRNCGLTWSANHKDRFIANGKTCNNCGLQNHFSHVCRKLKSTYSKPARPYVNSIEEKTSKKSVNAIQDTNYNLLCSSDYDSSNDSKVASIASTIVKIEPKNTILQIGNTKVGLLIDSGSVCSNLNESLAIEVINSSTLARWLMTATSQELKTFANEPKPIIGVMQTPV